MNKSLLIRMILLVAMTLTLFACGGSGGSSDSPNAFETAYSDAADDSKGTFSSGGSLNTLYFDFDNDDVKEWNYSPITMSPPITVTVNGAAFVETDRNDDFITLEWGDDTLYLDLSEYRFVFDDLPAPS